MEVAAPLKNDPILSGRSTGSFRHLELQNPSIISDFRHRDRMVQKLCENFGCAKILVKSFFSSIFHHHGGGGAT